MSNITHHRASALGEASGEETCFAGPLRHPYTDVPGLGGA